MFYRMGKHSRLLCIQLDQNTNLQPQVQCPAYIGVISNIKCYYVDICLLANMQVSVFSCIYGYKIHGSVYLVGNKGWIIWKPRILPLRLAMSKTRIQKYTILWGICKVFYHMHHIISEPCSKIKQNKLPKLYYLLNILNQGNTNFWIFVLTL